MREIALFVEDFAHQQVIGALVQRLAKEYGIDVRLDWRSAIRGHGRVVQEFNGYLRDLARQGHRPDLIIVATDANCSGLNERAREIGNPDAPASVVLAVPDPHIERWLLLDGAAFRDVFGKGCDAPDRKCDRDRYKQRLVEAIRESAPRRSHQVWAGSSSPKTSCKRWTSSAPCGPTAPSNVSSAICDPRSGSGGRDGFPGCRPWRNCEVRKKARCCRPFTRSTPLIFATTGKDGLD